MRIPQNNIYSGSQKAISIYSLLGKISIYCGQLENQFLDTIRSRNIHNLQVLFFERKKHMH
jgi:hypothetical protein